MSSTRTCLYCQKDYYSRGWCINHYMRWMRTGNPLGVEFVTPEDRFWEKVEISEGCWVWTAATYYNGYGVFRWNGKNVGAHRVAWEIATGEPPPPDLLVCHHCDNPPCVRFTHLFLGTYKDNAQDSLAKGRQSNGR